MGESTKAPYAWLMFKNDSTSRLIHDSESEGKEIPYVKSGHHNWYNGMNVYQQINRPCAKS
jgi:hypothetical protein